MTTYRPLRTSGPVPLIRPLEAEWEPARVPVRRAKKEAARQLRRIERARDAGDKRQVRYLTDRYLRSYSVKLAATAKVNTILKGGERAKSKELVAIARTIDPFRPADEQADVVPIKKANGNTRLLTLFGLKRSTEQRMVQQLLRPLHRPDPRQYAMQEGEDGRSQASQAVVNAMRGDAHWFIGLDITDYFPSIDTRRLHSLIPLPRRVIDNVICPPAIDDVRVRYNGHVDVIRLAEASQSGVSQGSRTSPIVADIVIKHILDGLHLPATIINYADDFGVMARTKRDVRLRTVR
jgi:Reverse transcriptase (RNA-dependent DNA polymerase)